ncbi:MAG: hypothetical protein AAGC44_07200 [Planctomycetota bacterium]
MPWHARYVNDPRLGGVIRVVTGRPAWVLKGTVAISVVVFAIPLLFLALLMLAALAVTALTWTVLSAIARLIESLTGKKRSDLSDPPDAAPHEDDGRENVRVMER